MLSDYSLLIEFNKKPVTGYMIQYLVDLTSKLIKVPTSAEFNTSVPKLSTFIKRLIVSSNVQTSTLMATTVYLTRLKNIIPTDAYGIETTRHRIFLGCLILVSKTLNDISPKNRHWAEYTGKLLDIEEVNTIELELLEYFKWNTKIEMKDLINSLRPVLTIYKNEMMKEIEKDNLLYFNAPLAVGTYKKLFQSDYNLPENIKPKRRLASQVSISSISTISTIDTKSSFGNVESIFEEDLLSNPYNIPLTETSTVEPPVKKDYSTVLNKRSSYWSINFKKINCLKTNKFQKFKNNLLKKE